MVRMHLQKGKAPVGMALPADVQAKVNEMADKSTLTKFSEGKSGSEANVTKVPADAGKNLTVPTSAALPEATPPATTPVTPAHMDDETTDPKGDKAKGQHKGQHKGKGKGKDE